MIFDLAEDFSLFIPNLLVPYLENPELIPSDPKPLLCEFLADFMLENPVRYSPVVLNPLPDFLVNISFFFYLASIAIINACLVYFAYCSYGSISSPSRLFDMN